MFCEPNPFFEILYLCASRLVLCASSCVLADMPFSTSVTLRPTTNPTWRTVVFIHRYNGLNGSVSLLRTLFNLKFLYKIRVSQKKYVYSLISYYPQDHTECNPDNNTSTLPHMMEIYMYRFHCDLYMFGHSTLTVWLQMTASHHTVQC